MAPARAGHTLEIESKGSEPLHTSCNSVPAIEPTKKSYPLTQERSAHPEQAPLLSKKRVWKKEHVPKSVATTISLQRAPRRRVSLSCGFTTCARREPCPSA